MMVFLVVLLLFAPGRLLGSSAIINGNVDSVSGKMKRIPVIIDTDAGIDDALALMLAIELESRHEVEIVAITCVSGNINLTSVLSNVSKTLNVCKRWDIPFYAGQPRPSVREPVYAADYHGPDGLGNCPAQFTEGPKPQNQSAIDALLELGKSRKGEITLILLGPATNLYVAHQKDENVTSYFKEIVAMGGNIHGVGNLLPGSEFNFAVDPEAAQFVVEHSKVPLTLLPWETMQNSWVPYSVYKKVTSQKSWKAQFLKAILKYVEDNHPSKAGEFGMGDILAVLAFLKPESVRKTMSRRIAVEVQGTYTAGQVVQAWSERMLPNITKETKIILEYRRGIVSKYFESIV